MDISKAKKVTELTKGDRKILITVYEGGQVSSCIEAEAKKYCETCQADDETCQEWIEHLKSQGYEATEIEVGELEPEESLPKFLEDRRAAAAEAEPPAIPQSPTSAAPPEPPAAVAEPETGTVEEVGKLIPEDKRTGPEES